MPICQGPWPLSSPIRYQIVVVRERKWTSPTQPPDVLAPCFEGRNVILPDQSQIVEGPQTAQLISEILRHQIDSKNHKGPCRPAKPPRSDPPAGPEIFPDSAPLPSDPPHRRRTPEQPCQTADEAPVCAPSQGLFPTCLPHWKALTDGQP